jgi:dihydrofolate reductase
MPRFVLIAAMDRRRAIGRDNALPWHLPDDLKRFKALTLGHPVLMGRKTAESIGRALPGRRNLVMSRAALTLFPGQEVVTGLSAIDDMFRPDEQVMVIGGAEIYRLTLPRAARLELTEVDMQVEAADVWFPELEPGEWCETANVWHAADARHACGFRFRTLLRVGSATEQSSGA